MLDNALPNIANFLLQSLRSFRQPIPGPRKLGKYSGAANGKREVARRLRQIATGKLQAHHAPTHNNHL